MGQVKKKTIRIIQRGHIVFSEMHQIVYQFLNHFDFASKTTKGMFTMNEN